MKKTWDTVRMIFTVLMTAAILAEMMAVGSYTVRAVREEKMRDTALACYSEL